MNRAAAINKIKHQQHWDIVILGGGATGLGAAVDAANRGYSTLLIEKYDFGKGTSSRSTKLIHGGVRYLAQGNIKLVMEALRERAYMLQNAPHLASIQSFVVPAYSFWAKWYYGLGLKLYDLLSQKLSIGSTKILSAAQTKSYLPTLKNQQLKGGIQYFDGQFNDAAFCINLAITATEQGATLINYTQMKACRFQPEGVTLEVEDNFTRQSYSIKAKAIINATGVFVDDILKQSIPNHQPIISPSQGVHLVINQKCYPSPHALMIPKTEDGRVLFAVPWLNKVVIGTTDTAMPTVQIEPKALDEEIDFIIHHYNLYHQTPISRKDVEAVFTGLRPLVKPAGKVKTALISREHQILVHQQLVTITGGKWTTYRKMAQDAVDNAVFVAKLPKQVCKTIQLPIGNPNFKQKKIQAYQQENSFWSQKIIPSFNYTFADIKFAVEFEMACTLEDVLARRTRLLFLNTAAALQAAPSVAACMQNLLQKDDAWRLQEIKNFNYLSQTYSIHP